MLTERISLFLPAAFLLAVMMCQRSIAQQPSATSARSVTVESRDVHKEIRAALRQPSKLGSMLRTLSEVERSLQDAYGFNVHLDSRAVDALGLSSQTPVNIDPKVRPLAVTLSNLLEPLDMTWAVRHESLILTSKDAVRRYLTTRLYDVSDLVPDPSQVPLVYSQFEPTEVLEDLISAIESSIRPDAWDYVGGEGSVEEIKLDRQHLLAIKQTDAIHEEVGALLESLRKLPVPDTAEDGGPKQQDKSDGFYTAVYPLLPNARTCEQLERVIRLSIDEGRWQEQDAFVRGVANAVVVRHDNKVQQQVYDVLVGLNAISPKYSGRGAII